jgi:hypothetical protein
MGNTLWQTFNRVQENLITGATYRTRAPRGYRTVSRRTRKVKGIDQNIDLNRTLWDLGRRVEKGLPLLTLAESGELALAQ